MCKHLRVNRSYVANTLRHYWDSDNREGIRTRVRQSKDTPRGEWVKIYDERTFLFTIVKQEIKLKQEVHLL